MGWFGGSQPAKVSAVTEAHQDKKEKIYLEDLPPKFEDKGGYSQDSTENMYAGALKQFKLSDISFAHYVAMPCFREAMITGFQAMGVLGAVTFLVRKNVNKSVNWAVCGFFLGSVVGWEQCRSIRRKSFQAIEKARQVNQKKNVEKLEAGDSEDTVLQKFKEQQSQK